MLSSCTPPIIAYRPDTPCTSRLFPFTVTLPRSHARRAEIDTTTALGSQGSLFLAGSSPCVCYWACNGPTCALIYLRLQTCTYVAAWSVMTALLLSAQIRDTAHPLSSEAVGRTDISVVPGCLRLLTAARRSVPVTSSVMTVLTSHTPLSCWRGSTRFSTLIICATRAPGFWSFVRALSFSCRGPKRDSEWVQQILHLLIAVQLSCHDRPGNPEGTQSGS